MEESNVGVYNHSIRVLWAFGEVGRVGMMLGYSEGVDQPGWEYPMEKVQKKLLVQIWLVV